MTVYKTILAPNAPWPKPQPVVAPKPKPKSKAKLNAVDLNFKKWLENVK